MLQKSIESANEEAANASINTADYKNEAKESQLNNDLADELLLAASETDEVKKPRKRTAKPKTEDMPESAEDIESDSAEVNAEPKKPRKRTAKPKTEDIPESAELDDIFTPISEEDIPTPSESSDTDSPIIITVSEEEETAETVSDEAENTDEGDEFVIPLFPASTYFSEDSPDETEANSIEEEEVEGEVIVHPDDLFSVNIKKEESAEECNTVDDGSAPVNEDGQYVIPELDDHEEPEEDIYDEEIPPEKYDPNKPRKIDGRFDFAELFIFTLLAVMIITSFFFRHSVVQGDSMMNTLYDGEHLIISDFYYTPERGDIVVCQDHTARLNTPIVKRIIAIGGDTIEITPTAIIVNGEALEEDYVFIDPYAMPYRYEPMAKMKVPEGEIFVMGDHRNNSKDSRDKIDLGTVSEDAILGRVLIRFYPFSKFGTVD